VTRPRQRSFASCPTAPFRSFHAHRSMHHPVYSFSFPDSDVELSLRAAPVAMRHGVPRWWVWDRIFRISFHGPERMLPLFSRDDAVLSRAQLEELHGSSFGSRHLPS
jgi:hypothetical protein